MMIIDQTITVEDDHTMAQQWVDRLITVHIVNIILAHDLIQDGVKTLIHSEIVSIVELQDRGHGIAAPVPDQEEEDSVNNYNIQLINRAC